MEEKFLDGKCLYSPSGAAREYAAVACNLYRGCPYQCKYCYNRKGWTSKVMGVDHAVLKCKFTNEKTRSKKYHGISAESYAMHVFISEVDKDIDYLRQTGIFYSFSTDPMCPDAIHLTVSTALYAISKGIPVRILTKNTEWDESLLSQLLLLPHDQRRLLSIGFTLTGCDDWEPFASKNTLRVQMMKTLHEKGVQTFASIEPVIDFTKSFQMIRDTLDCCDFYLIGLLSHFKDYYQDGSGKSFEGTLFFRRIFILQQILGLKIYYKESVKKHFEPLLFNLYDDRLPYQVNPVSSVYTRFVCHPHIYRLLNVLRCIHKNIALIYRYEFLRPEDEEFDIFCLYLFFMKFSDTDLLNTCFEEIWKRSESVFSQQFERLYQALKDLSSECAFFKENLMALDDRQLICSFDKFLAGRKTNLLPWLKICVDDIKRTVDALLEIINEAREKNHS